jgi:hypothetical protein
MEAPNLLHPRRAMTPHVSPWAERLKMNRRTLADYTPEMHERGWIRTVGGARRYVNNRA